LNKALFLDRDGVININHGYVHRTEDFAWVEGIVDLIKRANQQGYLVIVVTNQSGIGRGMYTEREFFALTEWMKSQVAAQGGVIDDVFFCPHHPRSASPKYLKICDCRKPNTGMLTSASRKWKIDLSRSIMVGDKRLDMQCAITAKLSNAYWLTDEALSMNDALTTNTDTRVKVVSHLRDIPLA
jgi:D-glycero-D-manno-heptose 1,7-bisphosphate phosphatase